MKNLDLRSALIFFSGAISSLAVAWLYGADFRFPDEKNDAQAPGKQQESTGGERVLQSAQIQQVIDGDTVILSTGEKVRLLGIDTPERGEHFYEEASDRLRELIGKKEVRLTKDVSETDRYGRLLRHIYVDDLWVNELMIKEGYAKFITYPPDVSHVENFKSLQKQALENNRGMWQDK